MDKVIKKGQKDGIERVMVIRRGQKRWYRGWLGLFPVFISPQIPTVFYLFTILNALSLSINLFITIIQVGVNIKYVAQRHVLLTLVLW